MYHIGNHYCGFCFDISDEENEYDKTIKRIKKMDNSVLKIEHLHYVYKDGDKDRVILDDCNICFEKGKFYSVTGESGSGKTTFLYCAGGLDSDYSGAIYYEGKDIREIGLEKYRRNAIAMIYQNYNLIPYLSPLQNMYLAVDITDNRNSIDRKEALSILRDLGIDHRKAVSKCSSLSGGEQQRVSITRAIAKNASVIVADEPTGNLDEESGKQVMEVFHHMAEEGKTIIMVTHNKELAKECDVHFHIDIKTKNLVLVK